MPSVKVGGKTKKFPYTPEGKAAAKKAKKKVKKVVLVKPAKNTFGISNLKVPDGEVSNA